MSGGYFDYTDFNITNIADDIERVILRNGKLKTEEELKSDYWESNPYYSKYSDQVIEEFKKGLHYLKLAYIYSHRIDYLLSGDDDEESFLTRLKEHLEEYNESK